MSPPEAADPVRLDEALRRVAHELGELRAVGQGLEQAIGDALLSARPGTGADTTLAHVTHLQNADLIVQYLGELSGFLTAISAQVPPGAKVDLGPAIADIRLRDLARGLAGGPRCAVLDQSGQVCGEVDLF